MPATGLLSRIESEAVAAEGRTNAAFSVDQHKCTERQREG